MFHQDRLPGKTFPTIHTWEGLFTGVVSLMSNEGSVLAKSLIALGAAIYPVPPAPPTALARIGGYVGNVKSQIYVGVVEEIFRGTRRDVTILTAVIP